MILARIRLKKTLLEQGMFTTISRFAFDFSAQVVREVREQVGPFTNDVSGQWEGGVFIL